MNVLCSTANYTQKPYFQFRDDYRIQNGKELTKVSKNVERNKLCGRVYYSAHISERVHGILLHIEMESLFLESLFFSRKTP